MLRLEYSKSRKDYWKGENKRFMAFKHSDNSLLKDHFIEIDSLNADALVVSWFMSLACYQKFNGAHLVFKCTTVVW